MILLEVGLHVLLLAALASSLDRSRILVLIMSMKRLENVSAITASILTGRSGLIVAVAAEMACSTDVKHTLVVKTTSFRKSLATSWRLPIDLVPGRRNFIFAFNIISLRSAWTLCSADCGGGIKSRTRYQECSAQSEVQTVDCNQQSCGQQSIQSIQFISEWSEWGLCSTSCGLGSKTRFRYNEQNEQFPETIECYMVGFCPEEYY